MGLRPKPPASASSRWGCAPNPRRALRWPLRDRAGGGVGWVAVGGVALCEIPRWAACRLALGVTPDFAQTAVATFRLMVSGSRKRGMLAVWGGTS